MELLGELIVGLGMGTAQRRTLEWANEEEEVVDLLDLFSRRLLGHTERHVVVLLESAPRCSNKMLVPT